MQIATRYAQVRESLTERARRLFVASEAMAFGYGGIAAASRATGMAASVIGRGIAEVRAIEGGAATVLPPTRSRRPGGGRKLATEKDPTLLADLQALVESTTRGDPESPLLWTARSQRNLVAALTQHGHHTSMKMVARLLKRLGYSLQANRKRLEGAQHPDRNAQFEHINETLVDSWRRTSRRSRWTPRKRSWSGEYTNGGRELRAQGDPEDVHVHDFVGADGKVAPYGVYDLQQNEAWVSVGVSHDTAEFAVQSIRTWWQEMGAPDVSCRALARHHGGRGRQQRLPAAPVEEWSCKGWWTSSGSRSPCVICPPGRASGTRSSIACSPSSPRTGAANRSSPIR